MYAQDLAIFVCQDYHSHAAKAMGYDWGETLIHSPAMT